MLHWKSLSLSASEHIPSILMALIQIIMTSDSVF